MEELSLYVLNEKLKALQKQIDKLDSGNDSVLREIKNSIQMLQEKISELDGDNDKLLNNLKNDIESLQNEINNLENNTNTALEEIRNDIRSLQNNMKSSNSSLDKINDDIESLQDKINSLENNNGANLDKISNDIKSLQNEIKSLDDKYALKNHTHGEFTTIDNNIKLLQDKVQSLSGDSNTSLTEIKESLNNYLPLSGGTMTGAVNWNGKISINNTTISGDNNTSNITGFKSAKIGDNNSYVTIDTTGIYGNIAGGILNFDNINAVSSLTLNGKPITNGNYVPLDGAVMNNNAQLEFTTTSHEVPAIVCNYLVASGKYNSLYIDGENGINYRLANGTEYNWPADLENLGSGSYLPLSGGTITGTVNWSNKISINSTTISGDNNNSTITNFKSANIKNINAVDSLTLNGKAVLTEDDRFNIDDLPIPTLAITSSGGSNVATTIKLNLGYNKNTSTITITEGTNIKLSNSDTSTFKISADFGSQVWPVKSGGTGLSTIPQDQVLIGNGTNNVATRAIDTTAGGTSSSNNLITSGAVYSGLAKHQIVVSIPSSTTNGNFYYVYQP